MTPEELTIMMEEMLGQLITDRKANTYSELMAAAYELWYFLRFDANCEFPPHDFPLPNKDVHFDF